MSVATNLLANPNFDTDVSGWAAGSNTTIARNASRYYAPNGSMQLTATAAGSVTATTSARVAVTAGNTYTAYAYFADVAAASGRGTTVTVTWYAAVTGGAAISSVTSSSSTLPNDTTWMKPPPVLIATAPAGANYASVTVSGTGLTAGGAIVTDVVSFGPPALVTNNILPYAVQGVEVDASGWQAVWQATVSATSSDSYEGWRSLAITSTATGACRAGTVASFPVTAGTEYMGYAWVYAPVSDPEWHTVIRWYDSAGTLISSSTQSRKGFTSQAWTRCPVIDTAPAGAVTAQLILEPVATAVGQVWLCDQMALLPTPIIPGNLLGYAAQGIEVDSAKWTAAGGCTKFQTSIVAYDGVSSLKIVCDGTDDATVVLNGTVPVTPRQAYRIAPRIYHAGRTSVPVVDLLFTWYDASGIQISSVFSRWTMGTAAGWYAPVGSAVAPAGAATLRIGMRFLNPANGDLFYADSILVAPGGLGIIADLIDGNYGARVSIQGLTTDGKTTYGLWRMLDDGTMTPVRGPVGDLTSTAITGDLAVVEDYEAPLGVGYRYYVKLWTNSSSYQASTSNVITLPEPEDTIVIIKDPGLPARWAESVVAKGGMPDWTRAARQGVNAIRGRARPIIISDVRTSRTGTMTLVTETQDELDAMWWLLETGNTLLLQWPSEWGERDVYVQVGDVTEAHVADYAGYKDRTWSIPLTEVDRPVGGITGSADRTWQAVVDTRTDWLDVMANATSWLDVYTGIQGG